jgi:hypothetical protein
VTATVFPLVGIAVCVALMTEKSAGTYARAGVLLAVGAVFWCVSRLAGGRSEPPP